MHLTGFRLLRFSLSFCEPLLFAGRTHLYRHGLLVELTASTGAVAWGEVAPLAGLHAETLEDCEASLHHLLGKIAADLPSAHAFPIWDAPPCVRFGLGCAVAGLVNPCTFVGHRRLPLCRLVKGDWLSDGGVFAESARLMDAHTIKVKVGHLCVDEVISAVRWLRQRLGMQVEIRLDGNRGWTLPEARAIFGKLVSLRVAWVEEPLRNPEECSVLAGEFPEVLVALDETLDELNWDPLRLPVGVRVVVIKPERLGAPWEGRACVARYVECGVRPVFSSPFFSGVGTSHVVGLAAAWDPLPGAVGVDSYGWLGNDVLVNRLPLNGPWIVVDDVLNSGRVQPIGDVEEVLCWP